MNLNPCFVSFGSEYFLVQAFHVFFLSVGKHILYTDVTMNIIIVSEE